MNLRNVAIVSLKDRDELKEKADKYDELTNYDYLVVETISEPVQVMDRWGSTEYRNETVSKSIYSTKKEEVVETLTKEVEKYRESNRQAAKDKIDLGKHHRKEIKKLKSKISTLWTWLVLSVVASAIIMWIL